MDPLPGPLPPGRTRAELVAEVAAGLGHLPSGAAVCVALSGGPDSTALAYLADEARPDLDLTLVHVRHGLRDDGEDREVVSRHAAWLGLPLVECEVSVEPRGQGIEAAARVARYRALRQVARDRGATAILVGHTADDQAETVVLRLARGTGLAGVAAMRRVNGDLVRPLLRVRRQDVHRFVTLEGLPTVQDPTNTDVAVRRSGVRQRVLPLLADAASDPVGALGRLADLAREDAAALDTWADEVAAHARRVGPVVCIADAVLAAVPPAVRRRVMRRLVQELTGGPPPAAATVGRVLSLAPGAAVSLPGGVRATAGAGWRAVAPASLPTVGCVPLAVPGTAAWLPAGLRVVAVTRDDPDAALGAPGAGQISLALPGTWTPQVPPPDRRLVPPGGAADRLHLLLPDGLGPLQLRHRRPGDRMRTAAGTRKLKSILIDAGVPRPVRDLWPIVTAGDGDEVVWVPGVAADGGVVRAGRHDPAVLLTVTA